MFYQENVEAGSGDLEPVDPVDPTPEEDPCTE